MVKQQVIISKLDKVIKLLQDQIIFNKEILNVDDAVTFLNMSISTIYHLTSESSLPYFKPHGKTIYFKRSELVKWMQQNKMKSIAELEDEAAKYTHTKR